MDLKEQEETDLQNRLDVDTSDNRAEALGPIVEGKLDINVDKSSLDRDDTDHAFAVEGNYTKEKGDQTIDGKIRIEIPRGVGTPIVIIDGETIPFSQFAADYVLNLAKIMQNSGLLEITESREMALRAARLQQEIKAGQEQITDETRKDVKERVFGVEREMP